MSVAAKRTEVVDLTADPSAEPSTFGESGLATTTKKRKHPDCGGDGAAGEHDDLYKCPICLDLCEAVVESRCGHLFCQGCIGPLRAGAMSSYILCPSCRCCSAWPTSSVLPTGWHRSKFIERIINQMPAPCPHTGCAVTVRRGELAAHTIACEHRPPSAPAPQRPPAPAASTAASDPRSGQPAVEVEHAIAYVERVKRAFAMRPRIYRDFLLVLQEFRDRHIGTPGVIERVCTLFHEYPNLTYGFNAFLPPGHRILAHDVRIGRLRARHTMQ